MDPTTLKVLCELTFAWFCILHLGPKSTLHNRLSCDSKPPHTQVSTGYLKTLSINATDECWTLLLLCLWYDFLHYHWTQTWPIGNRGCLTKEACIDPESPGFAPSLFIYLKQSDGSFRNIYLDLFIMPHGCILNFMSLAFG